MNLNRLDYVIWAVLGGLSLALAGLVLAGDRVGARITQVFPANGQTVGAYARIGIEFAQPMNPSTVENAFHLDPALAGRFTWDGQTLWFEPSAPLHPGRYTARLTGGVSREGRPVKQAPEWSFNVRPPQLAFLLLMGDGGFELGRASPPDSPTPGAAAPPSPEQLTHTQGRVAEFGVSHDGEQIAFTVKNAQDGADLWLMNRDGGQARGLVDCGRDTCSAPAWAPDGARLAYVRTPAAATGQTTNLGRVWTVQPASGQTVPLYQDPQVTGSEPAWSPDGRWLGFFDSHAGGLHLLDVQTSDSFILPSVMGQMGSWSPDSTHLAFADLALGGAQLATRLQMADIQNQSIQLVVDTDRGWLDFGPPAWSPAGDWIALSLRSAVTGGPGKQIWLMHPDGSAAHPVLADAAYGFGGYHWDPWGDRLVFQRYAVNDPQAQPEIMLWSPSAPDAAPVSVARSAALAAWLP